MEALIAVKKLIFLVLNIQKIIFWYTTTKYSKLWFSLWELWQSLEIW